MAVAFGTRSFWRESVERSGFAVIPHVLTPPQTAELLEAIHGSLSSVGAGVLERAGEVFGMRDLIWRVSEVRRLARSPQLLEIAQEILGPRAFAVRGLFFDKTLTTNWNLPWHQDVTIAVQTRCDLPEFGPWTMKAGIPHAHAPVALLERMVTLRVHLDDCGHASGPMRVLPGSHAHGKLDAGAVASWAARASDFAVDCLVPAGGVVVMRPLLLHSSASGTADGHRRVIHLEYAAEDLPDGLHWHSLDDEGQARLAREGASLLP